ncbi:MAG: hypothetical protein ABIJ24_06170 [Nitrospinota bacterium]|nr:hypothetical protein [Nitrospinota bacterium]
MRHKRVNYLKILKIELEDLKEDMSFMIKGIEEGRHHGHMSDHVFLGNITVLKTEILGVNTFERIVNAINPDDYKNLDEMIKHLQDKVASEVRSKELPEALFGLINRKLVKVADYVEHTSKA